MVDELMRLGFNWTHAKALAAAVEKAGRTSIDGLRFTLSGRLTSVYSDNGREQILVCQVDIV